MITMRKEKIENVADEIGALIAAHASEVGEFGVSSKTINYLAYLDMEKRGEFEGMVLCDDNGNLVGYAGFILFIDHKTRHKCADLDVLYIKPGFRTQNSLNFLKFCDEVLREIGCQRIFQSIKIFKNYGDKLESIGYRQCEIVYCKEL